MGYEVHITRKQEWSDPDGPRISADEWREYVASDRELVMTGIAEAETPEGIIQIKDPLLAEWRAHPRAEQVWISYFEGNLSIKNPDEECLAKMRRIAKALDARVQGDDGEFYDDDRPPAHAAPRESLFKRLSGAFAGFFRAAAQPASNITLDFEVGDRVKDTWGTLHTVIAIQRTANHGTGIILTRRDDGQELGHAMFAHDLKRVDPK